MYVPAEERKALFLKHVEAVREDIEEALRKWEEIDTLTIEIVGNLYHALEHLKTLEQMAHTSVFWGFPAEGVWLVKAGKGSWSETHIAGLEEAENAVKLASVWRFRDGIAKILVEGFQARKSESDVAEEVVRYLLEASREDKSGEA